MAIYGPYMTIYDHMTINLRCVCRQTFANMAIAMSALNVHVNVYYSIVQPFRFPLIHSSIAVHTSAYMYDLSLSLSIYIHTEMYMSHTLCIMCV